MTKRDVAVWFCKVVALVGMIGAISGLLIGLFNLGILGIFRALRPTLSFAVYFFVWFFAQGIGTELAAEGDHAPPMTSGAELGSLLMRCVGLWLFLSTSIYFGPLALEWVYEYFFSQRASANISVRFTMTNLALGFAQSILGFFLAFTPRIRLFFGK